jgi:hypothetical protein
VSGEISENQKLQIPYAQEEALFRTFLARSQALFYLFVTINQV